MISPPRRTRERLLAWLVFGAVAAALLAVNVPTVTSFAKEVLHDRKVNSQSYKEQKGHWSILPVPAKFQINAVHAALLYTGKVLIVAGSGNSLGYFKAGTFKSIIWDPATDKFKEIPTPSDMFCGGHAFLPDGKLLIAGGTRRYEKLASEVKRAGGVMTVQNQSPNGGSVPIPKGSEFVAPDGTTFRSTESKELPPAVKRSHRDGRTTVTASSVEVWVEAVQEGKSSTVQDVTHFAISGMSDEQSKNVFGIANSLTITKQDFWADNKSYLFNPATESYEKVSDLTIARWYPTLVGLKDGRVLAVSGLDQYGRIIEGDNEVFNPETKTWSADPALTRTFPTYPSLFLMPSGNELFYSGSNAGYGSATVGRTPGIWNLNTNSFQDVPGLRDPGETETSGSVLLPPAQAQRYMIVGGGGIGNSEDATARTDIAELNTPEPHFTPGPDLAQPTRYPNVVITPDNKVVITGGSRYYRGNHESDIFECHSYDPTTNKLTALADPTVGRNYHSEAMLLPDGRIVTLGGNPLYGNREDTTPGGFEKRIEIYSPPYLYHGKRPQITGGPSELARGDSARFTTPDLGVVQTVNLIRPSAVTHVTDAEQRSIALDFIKEDGAINVRIPRSEGLVPSGWYMLFVTNRQATPSVAHWVHIS
jgi:Domain of unknown function (DUF1929)